MLASCAQFKGCALLVALVAVCSPLAEANCIVTIRANDAKALVSVDDIPIGYAPLQWPCEDQPRQIRVDAPGRRSFVRMAPSNSMAVRSQILWDVQLSAALDVSEQRQAAGHLSLQDGHQTQLLQEIRQLKGLVESLVAQVQGASGVNFMRAPEPLIRPESTPLLKPGLAPLLRPEPTPVRKPAQVDMAPRLSGFYVQLKAFLSDGFVPSTSLERWMDVRDQALGAFFNFCQSAQTAGDNWMRVFLGPFREGEVAHSVARKAGEGAFVVDSPVCVPPSSTPRSNP